jgi:hypothetical protein
MVLHRRAQGEDFGSVMRDVRSGRVPSSGGSEIPQSQSAPDLDPTDPMNAYRAMRASGMTHDAVVEMLAKHVIDGLLEAEDERHGRAPSSTGLI